MAIALIGSIRRYMGLSTDTKPSTSDNVPIGSVFIETDTKDIYICCDGTNWSKYKRNSDLDRTSAVIRTVKPNDTYYKYGG